MTEEKSNEKRFHDRGCKRKDSEEIIERNSSAFLLNPVFVKPVFFLFSEVRIKSANPRNKHFSEKWPEALLESVQVRNYRVSPKNDSKECSKADNLGLDEHRMMSVEVQ